MRVLPIATLKISRDSNRPGFCNHPEAVGVPPELGDFEMLAQFRKPPGRWLLNEVSVAAVAKNLLCRPGCDGKEANLLGNRPQVRDDRVHKIRLDMFQHIDATNQLGGA